MTGRTGGEQTAGSGAGSAGTDRSTNDVLDQRASFMQIQLDRNLDGPGPQAQEPAVRTPLRGLDQPVLQFGEREGACNFAAAPA